MAEQVRIGEGPWVDDAGRDCLGVWADEGGQLLILRRETNGAVSFHVAISGETHNATVGRFRIPRVMAFLSPPSAEKGDG